MDMSDYDSSVPNVHDDNNEGNESFPLILRFQFSRVINNKYLQNPNEEIFGVN